MNLQCGALQRQFFLPSAVCSVACLEWDLRMGEPRARFPGQGTGRYPPEIFPAKEAKEMVRFAVENT